MNNLKDEIAMFTGDGVLAFLTATQVDTVLKWVSLALTILTTLVTLAFTIYKWWKKAKEDGKIDKEEIDEFIDIMDDAITKTQNIVEEAKSIKGETSKEDKEDDK